MLLNNNIIIYILIMINIILLIIGYLLGKANADKGVLTIGSKTTNKKIQDKHQSISIDDSKFVTDIKTDNLEKKYDQLGETKHSQENISESVNKLKNMKG